MFYLNFITYRYKKNIDKKNTYINKGKRFEHIQAKQELKVSLSFYNKIKQLSFKNTR